MNTLFRAAATAVATMLLLGVLVVPASADTNAEVPIAGGTLLVGKWFSEHCGKDGVATVTGRGLYYTNLKTAAGVNNGNREEHSVWHFEANDQAGLVTTNQKDDEPHAASYDIQLCGYLSPTVDGLFTNKPAREDGLGAACDNSRAHDGRGWMTDTTTGEIVQLQEVGWIAAPGEAITLSGKYVELNEANGNTKKTKPVLVDPEGKGKGSVLGTFKFRGGLLPCSGAKILPAQFNNGNGAQSFAVEGNIDLTNDVNGVPFHGAKCKNDGPPAGMDGVKKSHANEPGTGPCPEKDEP